MHYIILRATLIRSQPCLHQVEKATGAAKNHPVILTGDLNLPSIDWSLDNVTQNAYDRQHCQYLLDIMNNFHLNQLVNEPTRCTPSTANILDLVFTTKPALVKNLSVIPGLSDHSHLSFKLLSRAKRTPRAPRKVFDYKRGNLEGFKQDIAAYNTSLLESDPRKRSVEENWMGLKGTVSRHGRLGSN